VKATEGPFHNPHALAAYERLLRDLDRSARASLLEILDDIARHYQQFTASAEYFANARRVPHSTVL
jgi:hypothetical protein